MHTFLPTFSEGKVKMHILHVYNDYLPWVYDNAYKTVGAHYTWQNTVHIFAHTSKPYEKSPRE